jgi:hypothetical protein
MVNYLTTDGWFSRKALPLMNIVFGNLAGEFNRYFMPGAEVSEQAFKAPVNRNRYVDLSMGVGHWMILRHVRMRKVSISSICSSANSP